MPRKKQIDQETVNKIISMYYNGRSVSAIAEHFNIGKSTTYSIVSEVKKHRKRYPAHCYTCEYAIYSDVATSKDAAPPIKGCLMRCDTPKSCRRWLDDKFTADRVKADLRGK